jgi:hypothetical protein
MFAHEVDGRDADFIDNDEADELEQQHNDDDHVDDFDLGGFEAPQNNSAGELYHVNGAFISIPSHIHYAYRGPLLQTLSFYEYCPMISVMPKTDGITTNGRYPFDQRHPLYATHVQMQQSALAVPILAGQQPPLLLTTVDFTKRDWLKRGRVCAEYYLTLMVPWDLRTLCPQVERLDYECFRDICFQWRHPTASFIQRCRFAAINNMAQAVSSSAQKRKTLNIWRARSATKWNDQNAMREAVREEALDLDIQNADPDLDPDFSIEALVRALNTYTTGLTPGKRQALDYMAHQATFLQGVFEGPMDVYRQRVGHNDLRAVHAQPVISALTASMVSDIKRAITTCHAEEEEDFPADEDMPGQYTPLDLSPDPGLGHDQNRAFTSVLQHVQDTVDMKNPDQLLLIIHGGPGVGKSTFSRALVKRLTHQTLICFVLHILEWLLLFS